MSLWDGSSARGIVRCFKIVGQLKFVQNLHDFLLHGGRASRAETLIEVTKIVKELEEVQSVRTRRLAEIVEMMKAAGFSDEKIRNLIQAQSEIESVSGALDTILQYVEQGKIKVHIVAEQKITGPPPSD